MLGMLGMMRVFWRSPLVSGLWVVSVSGSSPTGSRDVVRGVVSC